MTINAINILPVKTAGCPEMGSAAKKKKMTVTWAQKRVGDVIEFDFNRNGTPDHTGVVISINSNGTITTIEGNTSLKSNDNGGCVMVRTRYKGEVGYFVRPKYDKRVTAKMVVATAVSQVGIKESPRNSNNVKYNTWFYGHPVHGNKYPWCMTFVEWLFAHVLTATTKPKGKYTGVIPQPTLEYKDKGKGVKQLQQFLTWYGIKTDADGEFGNATKTSLIIFQLTEGLTPDGVYGPKSQAKAKTYKQTATTTTAKKPPVTATTKKPATSTKTPTTTKKPVVQAKKGYSGPFPTLNTNAKIVNGMAYRMCYPYGTPQKKYTFKDGKPKPEYKAGIDKVYPNHKSWPNKRQKVGACCDVFTGVELGLVGIHVPKDLKNQLVEMPKMTKQLKSNGHYLAKDFKAGDVVQRGRKDKSGHTWVVCEVLKYDKEKKKFVGVKYVANAHYKHLHGCYAVMDAKPKNIVKSKWKYYKCYTVLGACRTWYGRGDYGWDVLYIQQFLKWAGFYFGTPSGDYTEGTEKAVGNFQKAVGLKVSGRVGKMTIEKMRTFKK